MAAATAGQPLSKEMLLSWEPVRMVTPRYMKELSSSTVLTVATRELSNLDMLYDYYNSVVIFYDVRPRSRRLESPPAREDAPDDPVARLLAALEELLLHYPCAAGLLVHNETNGRLEVKYLTTASLPPAPATGSPHSAANGKPASNGAAAAPQLHNGTLPSVADHDQPSFGVQFHVAHANVTLADLGDVSNPDPFLDVLFPRKPATPKHSDGGRPLHRYVQAFQVTTFKCGGFCLAHTCSHAYADGYTGAALLQNLCSIARGAGIASPPDMSQTRRVVLGAREPPTPTVHLPFIRARKPTEQPPLKHLYYGTATRFKFTADALESLRVCASRSADGLQAKKYSRNQALMALLWTALARVSLRVHELPGSHVMHLRFAINLRTRGIPDLTVGYMGNAVCQCTVSATLQELCESSLGQVADKFKQMMGSLDFMEFVRSVVDDVELKLRDGLIPFTVGLGMPSLVGLPFYDTDCGWGAPMYVGRPSQQLSDRCIIMDHPAARAWNVLVVFASAEEQACFRESIAEYI